MNVLIVADGHYYKTPDGKVYADSVYDYVFYKRYLQAFDHVYAAVRITELQEAPRGKKLSSGEGVTFLPLPAYRGPIEYIKKYFSILKCVKNYCKEFDCAIFRLPAATANIFSRIYAKTKKPFAIEIVVDPWENFSPRASGNKLMLWIVRRNWTNIVKTMCAKADGASYVTKSYLQKRYPPKAVLKPSSGAFTAAYSSVELSDDTFASARVWTDNQKKFCIAHVSNAFTGYEKGHLTLMKAVKIVRDQGYDVSVRFVGDGPLKEEFEQHANELGIADFVEFTGRLANGDEVRKVIRSSDLFVLPTLAEGLPRALLEAMAEGMPCLSSPTCGVPEVLDKDFLFDFEDEAGFAQGIISFISSPERMSLESQRNVETAKQFASSLLNERRKSFYCSLRQVAEVAAKGQGI